MGLHWCVSYLQEFHAFASRCTEMIGMWKEDSQTQFQGFDQLCTGTESIDVAKFVDALGHAKCCSPQNCGACESINECTAQGTCGPSAEYVAAVTAAARSACEVQPGHTFSNGECLEVIYLEEDGANGEGWSRTETFGGFANGEKVHGPWGNDLHDVSRDFAIPSGVSRCRVCRHIDHYLSAICH
jgi:hypothetical protein